jgi:hypothetical protein
MRNGNGELPVRLAFPGTPDSGYTITVRGCFPPMDNGEHLLTQDEPGDLSHFITDYDWAGGMGNAEWRKRDASCSPGQGDMGNDQLGMANAPCSAMEWTMDPGKTQSKL